MPNSPAAFVEPRERLFVRRVQLAYGDGVALVAVFLCKVGAHVVDEGAGGGGGRSSGFGSPRQVGRRRCGKKLFATERS